MNSQSLPEIKSAFKTLSTDFTNLINSYVDHFINIKKEGKWSIGEETEHVILAAQGTLYLINQPKENLPASDHASKSYDELELAYKSGLALTPGINNPLTNPQTGPLTKKQLVEKWENTMAGINKDLDQWTDEEMDKVTVWKHPLLGKLTPKEMLLFTIFHSKGHILTINAKISSFEP